MSPTMWWQQPRLKDFPSLLPNNLLDVIVRAFGVVEVGGLSGYGPERGRNFERLFYSLCTRRGVKLCERAGSQTLALQKSASGFAHEVDGATRSAENITHWELKHLTTKLDKNELLIFNSKGLDYFYGCNDFLANIPILRFLLSGWDVGTKSRTFATQWGIVVIEPGRLPLPLLYEVIARDGRILNMHERDAVKKNLQWACRPLQSVLRDLSSRNRSTIESCCGSRATRRTREILSIQEELGAEVIDYLDGTHPEWIDEVADDTWREIGGW